MGEGLSMNCTKCGNEMSDFEVHHMEWHHPDKQLCRPCVCYKEPKPFMRSDAENNNNLIDRLLKLAGEQGE